MGLEITGSVFIRHNSKWESGRKVILIGGIIAIPVDIKIEGEKMYTVVGKPGEGSGLTLYLDNPHEPLEKIQPGLRFGHIFEEHGIWRV